LQQRRGRSRSRGRGNPPNLDLFKKKKRGQCGGDYNAVKKRGSKKKQLQLVRIWPEKEGVFRGGTRRPRIRGDAAYNIEKKSALEPRKEKAIGVRIFVRRKKRGKSLLARGKKAERLRRRRKDTIRLGEKRRREIHARNRRFLMSCEGQREIPGNLDYSRGGNGVR